MNSVLFLLLSLTLCVESNEDPDDWNDNWIYRRNLFTFTLPANDVDCFYEKVETKKFFYTSFKVAQPQDGTVTFQIQHFNHSAVYSAVDKGEGSFENTVTETDTFSFCFLNYGYTTSAKTIEFYLMSMGTVDNTTKKENDPDYLVKKSLAVINRKTLLVLNEQAVVQMENSRDMTLAEENRGYVQMSAVFHIFLFIGTAILQVVFVRYLFKSPPGSKVFSRGA